MATPRTTKRIQDAFSLARHNRYSSLVEMFEDEINVLHPDSTDDKGNTILIVACQNGLRRIAKLALRVGCDIDWKNDRGNTALHFCYMYGFGATMGAYLKEKGADDSLRNHRQQTCYDVVMSPGLASPKASKSPHFSRATEPVIFEDDEVPMESLGTNDFYSDNNFLGSNEGGFRSDQAGWESEYLEQYVDGGYQSNEVWGAGADEGAGDYYGNQDGFWQEGKDGEGEGGEHYVDEASGLQCYTSADGERYYWDVKSNGWVAWTEEEEKVEAEEKEVGQRAIAGIGGGGGEGGQVREEKHDMHEITWAEARPDADAPKNESAERFENGYRVSKTKRRPPPQAGKEAKAAAAAEGATGRRRPPPLRLSSDGDSGSRRKGERSPKRKPPPPKPGKMRSRSSRRSSGRKNRSRSSSGASGSAGPNSSSSDESNFTHSSPQMQLMSCVCSQNYTRLMKVLSDPLLTGKDIHPAILNAAAKGCVESVKRLAGKADSESISGCLLLSCKTSNVEVIKVLAPLASSSCLTRCILRLSRLGQLAILPLFLGSQMALGHEDVARILTSFAKDGLTEASKVVVKMVEEGEWSRGGREQLDRAYRRATMKALTVEKYETAKVTMERMDISGMEQALSMCAGRGSLDAVRLVVESISSKDCDGAFKDKAARHAMEVAKGKGRKDVESWIRENVMGDSVKKDLCKRTYSAKDLMKAKRSAAGSNN